MDEDKNQLTDISGLEFTPPPLADPVITAIFQDASVSGLAMKSLLNANLADSGDALISDVVSVTPQRVHTDTGERGYRIDVEATTVAGEIVLCDVQLRPFSAMNERSLLYGEQSLSSGAKRGDKLADVTAKMPRVIVLNILDFVLRPSGKNFHQVAELTYREEPRERAVERFEIHHLQLPRFRELKPDFKSPLHCWLTAICRAQEQKVFMSEVVEMDTALKAYYEVDPGFAQFVARHGYVASLPEVRKEYKLWQIEQVVMGEENARVMAEGRSEGSAVGRTEGIAVGRTEGRTEGRAERDMEIALKAFRKVKPGVNQSLIIDNLKDFDISEEIIRAAQKQADSERTQARREKRRSEQER
jgi:hypothetical protein